MKSVAFGGKTYPVSGTVASADVERVRNQPKNKDAQKVATGAVVGAIAGQIFGKSTKSTIIGAAAGAAAGAGVAAATSNYEGCVPDGGAIAVEPLGPVAGPRYVLNTAAGSERRGAPSVAPAPPVAYRQPGPTLWQAPGASRGDGPTSPHPVRFHCTWSLPRCAARSGVSPPSPRSRSSCCPPSPWAQYVRTSNDPFGGKPAPIAPVSVAKAILDRNDKDIVLDDGQRDAAPAHSDEARFGERAVSAAARRSAPDVASRRWARRSESGAARPARGLPSCAGGDRRLASRRTS